MTTIQLTVTLPDNVARSAQTYGLLQPDSLAVLIEREIIRQQSLQRLAALNLPPLTAEEAAAEIEATRREHQSHRS